jgi:hypothetical protein
MSTLTTTAVERYQLPIVTEVEQTTLLRFVAGCGGFRREPYAFDLRQFTAWCWQHGERLFDIH